MDTLDVVIIVVAVIVAAATILSLPSRQRKESAGQWRGFASPTAAAAMTLIGMVLIIISVLLR